MLIIYVNLVNFVPLKCIIVHAKVFLLSRSCISKVPLIWVRDCIKVIKENKPREMYVSFDFITLFLMMTGYYCSLGSTEISPTGQSYGDVCPAGNYCPNATAVPNKCPLGTYLDVTGMGDINDCISCSPGNLVLLWKHLLCLFLLELSC